jgi:branched-chain amino acid transport system permease protein
MPLNTVTKYIRKAYTEFITHVYDIPPRMLAFLILIMFTLLPHIIPYGRPLREILSILISANLMAILAVSWDLLVGRTGLISLGHALFYGVGAYGTAILYKYFGWPFWITIPLGMLAGAGIALIIGFPCLRLKGPYLALLTMAFPLSIIGFLYYFGDIFGSERGIADLPRIFPGLKLYDRFIADYYLSLALLTICSIIIYKLATSKTGIVFVSILDDELATKACGINVTKYKLMSLAMSGLFGSLAGAFYAHMVAGSANPRFFIDITALLPMENSLVPIIAAILGGIGTIYGPIVGVYIYRLLQDFAFPKIFEYLKAVGVEVNVYLQPHIALAVFISIIVLLIVRWPRGIARAIVEWFEDLEEPREVEEILKEKAEKK